MGEVIEMASFTKAPAPAACSGLADHAQDRDAITIDLTDQFVCPTRVRPRNDGGVYAAAACGRCPL
jgi:hypothetical protein